MPTTHLDLVARNNKRRVEIQQELRAIDEATFDPDTSAVRAYTDDESARITELRSEQETVNARLEENLKAEMRSKEIEGGLERLVGAMVDRDSGDVYDGRSLGERFADTDEYRQWAKTAQGRHLVDFGDVELRAVTDATTASGSAGTLTRPTRLDRIGRDFIDRKVYLLDRVPHIPITQGSVEYVQDVTPLADMPNKAVEVAESGTKPQAGVTFQLKSESAAVVAAWVNISRQAAQDIPQIQAYLDGRLRYSLKRRIDSQLINGTGVAPNLTGLLNRSGILTYSASSEARYRSVRHAIRLMEDVETVPELIVVNPADAEIFDLSNDTSAGLHAVNAMNGDLQNGPARTMWGLEVVKSTAITSGTALLIDPNAIAVFDRMGVQSYMTDSHAGLFVANILTLLLETRVGLGLFDPTGVCKVTFSGTT